MDNKTECSECNTRKNLINKANQMNTGITNSGSQAFQSYQKTKQKIGRAHV